MNDDRRIEEWPNLERWDVRFVAAVVIVASCAAFALVPWGWAMELPP
jgi:hypothetical protein